MQDVGEFERYFRVDRDRAGAQGPRHPGRPADRQAGRRRAPWDGAPAWRGGVGRELSRPHPRRAVPPPDRPCRAGRAGVNRQRPRAPAGRGHAVCTSKQAHDQPASRRTVRHPPASAEPRVHRRLDAHAGARHRRHDRHLQRRLRPVLRPAALPSAGPPGDGVGTDERRAPRSRRPPTTWRSSSRRRPSPTSTRGAADR